MFTFASDDAATKEEITELISDFFEIYDDYELMARRNSDNTTAKFNIVSKVNYKTTMEDLLMLKKERLLIRI